MPAIAITDHFLPDPLCEDDGLAFILGEYAQPTEASMYSSPHPQQTCAYSHVTTTAETTSHTQYSPSLPNHPSLQLSEAASSAQDKEMPPVGSGMSREQAISLMKTTLASLRAPHPAPKTDLPDDQPNHPNTNKLRKRTLDKRNKSEFSLTMNALFSFDDFPTGKDFHRNKTCPCIPNNGKVALWSNNIMLCCWVGREVVH